MIFWIAILIPSLLIMTWFTKRLPVTLVPEQLLITTVRNNVVYNSCLGNLPDLLTLNAKRVTMQELLPSLLPPGGVPTLAGALSITYM